MKPSLALLAIACANAFAAHVAIAANVATVNGVAVTDAQVARAQQQSGLADSVELRAALKNQLIARELFRQEAAKKNFSVSPAVQAAAMEARDNAMVQQYLRTAIKPNAVTEEQVKTRYDTIVASLGEQEYKPRLILVADGATAQSLLAQLKSGADFTKLARVHSKAPSAQRGGELDWVSFKLPLTEGNTQGYPVALAEAIAKLPADSISAALIVVNSQRYLLKVDDVRPTAVPQYEQVKPAIRQLLEQQEMERATAALVANLIKNAKIE